MELVTLKQYAISQRISYEAVRRQVTRYQKELSGHIIKRNRTQFLDEKAVEFLTDRRRSSPIILMNMDQSEENARLKEQVESLKAQLMTAQNELLKSQDDRLKAQERIIALQDEAKKTLEDQAKYAALLEDNRLKAKKLQEAEDQIMEIQKEREEDQLTIQTIRTEADDLREEADGLRKKADEDRRTIEDLQEQRDAAQAEAQSYKRSIFGFYRKR